MSEQLYDVVAVTIKGGKVRLLATKETHAEADAIVKMAVMRCGVEEEFFSEVPHDFYKEGDVWEGNGGIKPYKPETSEDGRIMRIGNMCYPVGKRGL